MEKVFQLKRVPYISQNSVNVDHKWNTNYMCGTQGQASDCNCTALPYV